MSDDLLDLIEKYFSIIKPVCDAPDSFIIGSALSVVSDLLGRFFTAHQMPYSSRGGLPVFWYIMASIPGRMRRSSVARYADYIRKKALIQFYQKTSYRPTKYKPQEWNELTEDEKNQVYEQIYADTTLEEGSPEGIADAIQYAYEEWNINVFRILSTEFGPVLKRASGNGYENGALTLLSKLRYGESGRVNLSRRRGQEGVRMIPEGLYVLLFAGMQEPWNYIDEAYIRQGTARRILIDHKESNPNWIPPLSENRDQVWDKLDQLSDQISDLMTEYHEKAQASSDSIGVIFLPEVVERVNQLARGLDERLDSDASDVNIFRQSMWEHVVQIAMLKKISTGDLHSVGAVDILNVSSDELSWAMQFVRPIWETAETIVDSLGVKEVSVPSYRRLHERILRYLRRASSSGMSRTDLNRSLGNIRAGDLNEAIDSLKARNLVIMRRVNEPGSPHVRYWMTEFSPEESG